MQRGRRLGTRGLGDVDEYGEGVRENVKELDVDKEGGFRFLLQYTLWDQGGEDDGRGGESRKRERVKFTERRRCHVLQLLLLS